MRRNILYTGKKRYCGGGDEIQRIKLPTQIDIQDDIHTAKIENPQFIKQNPGFMANANNFVNKYGGAIQGGMQLAETAVGGFKTGNSNTNQGMYDTSIGVSNQTANDANNVSNTYTAGMNQMNLMSKTGNGRVSARDLKTHKGWKNVLGSTGKGAMAGMSIGNIVPGIGTAVGGIVGGVIGGVSAGVGELFGWAKRRKQAREMNQKQKESDFAVDYYNSKQAEQLASANDNAANSMANQNRYSIFGLMARGGRRNLLINNKHKRLC